MKRKSLLLCIAALMTAAATAVGGTLAYFTGSDKAENTFTVGNVAIALFEHDVEKITDENGISEWVTKEENGKKIEVQKISYEGIYPGAKLPKDPAIRNTGANPAYVRMKVILTNASAWSKLLGENMPDTLFEKIAGKWTLEGSAYDEGKDTITFICNYSDILKPGEETTPLFTFVNIPTGFNNEEIKAIGGEGGSFTVKVNAEAIQAEGFDSYSEAFAAMDNQSGSAV